LKIRYTWQVETIILTGLAVRKTPLSQDRSTTHGFHRGISMENEPSLTSLLREYHLRIIWDENIKYWWLEGTDFTNRQWQSPIFFAADENKARLAAIHFIQTESAGNPKHD
jgi:hypothetical protein